MNNYTIGDTFNRLSQVLIAVSEVIVIAAVEDIVFGVPLKKGKTVPVRPVAGEHRWVDKFIG